MKDSFLRRYGPVLLLTLLAFALRAYRLDFFSLRGDESFTVLFVQKPLAQMWHETLTVEPNPPLLYFLLRGWIALAGAGEFATRYFSAWFGVLCVPFVYRAARSIFAGVTRNNNRPRAAGAEDLSDVVGLIAAFLIAVNPYQIWHSQDVRNYTMWPLLSLAALVLFWKWYKSLRGEWTMRTRTARSVYWLGGFTVVELAALYTHYYEAFILLALNVFVFAALWRDLKKLLQWIGAQVVLAVVYLPYPLILSNRVSAYGEGSGREGVALWDMARETFSAFVVGETLPGEMRAWLWIPFALAAVAGLVLLFARDAKRGLFFVLYVGVPTGAVFALNMVRPLYLERYLNGVAPAYYLLVAFGVTIVASVLAGWVSGSTRSSLSRGRGWIFQVSRFTLLAGAALCAFFALTNYWTNPAYAKAPDWRGLASIINANAQRGDLIVQNFPETSLVYYDRSKLPLVVYPKTYLPDGETERALNAMNANNQRAWFIPAAPDYWDPNAFVEGWLNHHDDMLNEWQTGDFRLRLYATPSLYLNTLHKTNLVLGNAASLVGYRTERRGNALRVVLYWRSLGVFKQSYDVRLEALDANGKVVQEQSSPPVDGAYPTTKWRKNELVVDQHTIPDAAGAKQFRVYLCDGDLCVGSPETLPVVLGK